VDFLTPFTTFVTVWYFRVTIYPGFSATFPEIRLMSRTNFAPDILPFWGAYVQLKKTTISFVMSACPSVRVELGSNCTDFNEVLYLRIFRKSVEKIQVALHSDKNNRYFTWRPVYIYDNFSLNYITGGNSSLVRRSKIVFWIVAIHMFPNEGGPKHLVRVTRVSWIAKRRMVTGQRVRKRQVEVKIG